MPTFVEKFAFTLEFELEDCNPLALTCATKLQPCVGVTLRVIASSSFYNKPTTFKYERYGGDPIPKPIREIEVTDEDGDSEGESDDEDTNEDEQRMTGNTRTITRIRKRMVKVRVPVRIQMTKMRKRMVTNMRMIMRKRTQAPTLRSIGVLKKMAGLYLKR
ncbi:putative late blight resistance protein R1C-3 isoform X1 [Salvia divinorum]|uniref:Late blight resistance protein R1C-3 isoform X1 n=1 Tax=Salvia divinorum TaxID=28513 RepID=A0ABD1GEF9_SALDI